MTGLEQYYRILKIESGASVEEIKKAYRQLAKKWHPDNFNDSPEKAELAEAKFLEIHEAYEILKNHGETQRFDGQHDSEKQKQTSTFIRRNLDTNEKKAEFYYQLGVEEAENEQWEEAVRYFSYAIKLDERFINAYFYRGAMLDKLGLKLRAESDWQQAEFLKSIQGNRVEFYEQNSNHKGKKSTSYKQRGKNYGVSRKSSSILNGFVMAGFGLVIIALSLALVNQNRNGSNNNQGFLPSLNGTIFLLSVDS